MKRPGASWSVLEPVVSLFRDQEAPGSNPGALHVLDVSVILGLERRRIVFANATTNPTAEWLAQQVVNAFPWDTAPRFLIRDRDGAYGHAFSERVKGLGIREIRTALRAPTIELSGFSGAREGVGMPRIMFSDSGVAHGS
jgi:hypothetical protein